MSATAKRYRAVVIAIIAALSVNYAISFASGVPTMPNSPRPKAGVPNSGVPTMPNSPRP